jgi:hypothetical protein
MIAIWHASNAEMGLDGDMMVSTVFGNGGYTFLIEFYYHGFS